MPPFGAIFISIEKAVYVQCSPSISIIIVGFRSRRYLDRCLTALFAQQVTGSVEIIFVENNSRDESVAYIQNRFPRVLVIESDTNLGYAGGNNLGAASATGEILVFLNPDTEVAPNWLCELIRPLVEDPSIGLTTSKIVMMDDPGRINACGNEISLSGITWCRGAGALTGAFTDDADVLAVSGCSFAIPAALFSQLGGFDERFFMYLEDTDLSWRARVAGFRCRFVARSVVAHDYHLSLSAAKIERIERNRYLMLGKHLSRRSLLALSPVLIIAEILTWGYAGLHGRACLMAKARATGWAIRHLSPVIRTSWRPAEGSILRDHQATPVVVEGIGGKPSRVVQSALGLAARGAAAISLRLLPLAEPPSPPLTQPARITHRNQQLFKAACNGNDEGKQ